MSVDALGNFAGKHLAVFGAGYVGTAIVAAARRSGLTVTALTRNAETARQLAERGATPVLADLQGDAWHGAIPRADLVVNCVSSGGAGITGYRTSYVDGTASILRWLDAVGPADVLLYTSSTSVYPQRGGTVDEGAPTGESIGSARILLEAEELMAQAAGRQAARCVVLRLAGIYGPGRHYLLDQLRAGVTPLTGRGEHRLNLVHRDDIVAGVAAALVASRLSFDCFNVCDDAPTPKSEMVRWLAERIGVPFPGFSGESDGGRRPAPPDRAVSNAKAKRLLGWRPRYPNFRSGYEAILGA